MMHRVAFRDASSTLVRTPEDALLMRLRRMRGRRHSADCRCCHGHVPLYRSPGGEDRRSAGVEEGHEDEKRRLRRLEYRPVLYAGHIGTVTDYAPHLVYSYATQEAEMTRAASALFKYGVTTDAFRRIHKEHRRDFPRFEVGLLTETPRYREIESILTRELKTRRLLVRLRWKRRLMREIAYFRDAEDERWFRELVQDLAKIEWNMA